MTKSRSPSPLRSPLKNIENDTKSISIGNIGKVLKSYSIDYYIRLVLILATVVVYLVCLILFFTNHVDKTAQILNAFKFTSSFLFNGWYMGLVLTAGFVGLILILIWIKNFNLLFIFFYIFYIVFFAIGFTQVYCTIQTQSTATPQVMSIISALAGFGMIPLLFYLSSHPLISILFAIPSLFILGGCIYIGGVLNGEYHLH